MARFINQQNNYSEVGGTKFSWLWCLLFGCFYFAYKGAWNHAIIGFFVATFTVGVSWFIYPFFAYMIANNVYRRKGWVSVSAVMAASPVETIR